MERGVPKAIWTLVSVTVGAGIIGLPYVMWKAGFLTGLLVIIFVSVLMIFINLYLGEVLLRTRIKHQIAGLANIYLGKFGKHVTMLFESLSIYGALTAYILGSGAALKAILGGDERLFSVVFFVLVALVIVFGINVFGYAEFILNPLKVLVVLILSLVLFKFVNFSNLTVFNVSNLLIPYGVAVFAFAGFSVIPEMNQEIRNKINLKKAIIFGGIITFVVYILFSLAVVGSVGGNVTEVSTTSLNLLGSKAFILANIFTIFAMTTAFVGLGFALKENYTLDYNTPNWVAWVLTILFPFLLFISNFGGFIFFLEITGTISLGFIFFLILLMHSKAKKLGDRKPEYELKDSLLIKGLIYLLIFVGILYMIYGFF